MHRLAQSFAEYFETVPANTPALMNEVYKLRYEVFCSCQRLDPMLYPDGLERDTYDAQATHSLLVHRPSGLYAGTLRVIIPKPSDADWQFHIEHVAGPYFRSTVFSPQSVPRHAIGEISRFCLSPRFRTRPGEQRWPDGMAEAEQTPPPPANDRRTFPHPVLGLIISAVRMSWELGLTYWYAMMEPRLERRLKQFGMVFEPISETFEYYGARRAYLAYLPQMLQGIRATHPDIWDLLTNSGRIAFLPVHLHQDALAQNDEHAP